VFASVFCNTANSGDHRELGNGRFGGCADLGIIEAIGIDDVFDGK
jgi:hypothetical protein